MATGTTRSITFHARADKISDQINTWLDNNSSAQISAATKQTYMVNVGSKREYKLEDKNQTQVPYVIETIYYSKEQGGGRRFIDSIKNEITYPD